MPAADAWELVDLFYVDDVSMLDDEADVDDPHGAVCDGDSTAAGHPGALIPSVGTVR